MNRDENTLYSDDDIDAVYRSLSVELPNQDIDKVVLAAARRNSVHENAVTTISKKRLQFWERLRIPVSMAAAAVVTLTFAQLLFPLIETADTLTENRSMPPGGSSDLVFQDYPEASFNGNSATEEKAEHVIWAPELPSQPMLQKTDRPALAAIEASSAVDTLSNSIDPAGLWAVKIIELAKSGEYQEMNLELAQFVKKYPEYPILKLIRPYIN